MSAVRYGAVLLAALSTTDAAKVTPIEKVLEMMQGMVDKGVAAKQEEEVKFSAFNQWCTNQQRIKNDEIEAGWNKIQELKAQIEKHASDIAQLTSRIEELDEDVGRWEKDKKAATAVRDKENADFKATVTDYTESLTALAGAIEVLSKQQGDTPQAEFLQSLLQVQKSRVVPMSAKRALMSFIQMQQPVADSTPDAMPDDRLSYEAPEAAGYSSQSGGVVEMLTKLEDEFKEKKTELEKEELGAQQAFAQIIQQLSDNIENAEHEINKKEVLRGQTQEAKAEAEGDLAQTTADRSEDQTYLADTEALCAQKTSDFNSRQKLRQEELDAIKKAMEIIGSGDVAGAGEKHLPKLIQIRGSALLQVRNDQRSPVQKQISEFLAERARESGSALLAQVSQQVASDPFAKVKKMIKDLISKLVQEATEEAEHHGWCQTELTTNKQTRDKKTEEVNILKSDIDDLEATIAQLTQDIADLTAALEELATAMADATAERGTAKAKNEATISDAKAAQTAVEAAMAVMKDFYAKAAEATALVQAPADDAPETFEKPYTGLLPEGGNVVDFLDVILSDFSRLESETVAEEGAEAEEFKAFMFESEKDQALKQNEKGHKEETKTQKESALHSANEELVLTMQALNKANTYYEKLKPTCVDSGITYEERVKRREAEMQSLQEALKILSGTDVDVSF
jgi:chromosome segregation ATPase